MKKLVNTKVKNAKTAEELEAQKAFDEKKAEVLKKHNVPDAFRIKVGELECWVKKPNRADISMSRSLGEGEEIKIKELLLDAVWLEGDEKIKTDDDYFFNVFAYLDNLIEAKAVELKKK